MDPLNVTAALLALVLGVAIGAWGYRYFLKKDPAAIERLAAQAKKLGEAAKNRAR